MCLAAIVGFAYAMEHNQAMIGMCLICGIMGIALMIISFRIKPTLEYTIIAYTDDSGNFVVVNAKPAKTKPVCFPAKIKLKGMEYTFVERKDEVNAIYAKVHSLVSPSSCKFEPSDSDDEVFF